MYGIHKRPFCKYFRFDNNLKNLIRTFQIFGHGRQFERMHIIIELRDYNQNGKYGEEKRDEKKSAHIII